MPATPEFENIDKQKTIAYLSKIITEELIKLDISEKRLGWLMGGLSQGTINKLRQGKFRNIPDYDTLAAVANYFGKKYYVFFKEISEQNCSDVDDQAMDLFALNRIHQTNSRMMLAEMASTAATQLRNFLVHDIGK